MIVIKQNTIQLLFALIRSAICGNQLSEQELSLYIVDVLPDLLAISRKHDIAHLVAEGLNNNGLLTKEDSEAGDEIIKAIYRHAQQGYEYVMLCNALEEAHIPFIPLMLFKPSVARMARRELSANKSIDKVSAEDMNIFLNEVGL